MRELAIAFLKGVEMEEFDGFLVQDTKSNTGRILHIRYGGADGSIGEIFWPCPAERSAEFEFRGEPLPVQVLVQGSRVLDVRAKARFRPEGQAGE